MITNLFFLFFFAITKCFFIVLIDLIWYNIRINNSFPSLFVYFQKTPHFQWPIKIKKNLNQIQKKIPIRLIIKKASPITLMFGELTDAPLWFVDGIKTWSNMPINLFYMWNAIERHLKYIEPSFQSMCRLFFVSLRLTWCFIFVFLSFACAWNWLPFWSGRVCVFCFCLKSICIAIYKWKILYFRQNWPK